MICCGLNICWVCGAPEPDSHTPPLSSRFLMGVQLRREFEQYGPIRSLRMVNDEDGKPRGYVLMTTMFNFRIFRRGYR